MGEDFEYEVGTDEQEDRAINIASAPARLISEGRVEEANKLIDILEGCC